MGMLMGDSSSGMSDLLPLMMMGGNGAAGMDPMMMMLLLDSDDTTTKTGSTRNSKSTTPSKPTNLKSLLPVISELPFLLMVFWDLLNLPGKLNTPLVWPKPKQKEPPALATL